MARAIMIFLIIFGIGLMVELLPIGRLAGAALMVVATFALSKIWPSLFTGRSANHAER